MICKWAAQINTRFSLRVYFLIPNNWLTAFKLCPKIYLSKYQILRHILHYSLRSRHQLCEGTWLKFHQLFLSWEREFTLRTRIPVHVWVSLRIVWRRRRELEERERRIYSAISHILHSLPASGTFSYICLSNIHDCNSRRKWNFSVYILVYRKRFFCHGAPQLIKVWLHHRPVLVASRLMGVSSRLGFGLGEISRR